MEFFRENLTLLRGQVAAVQPTQGQYCSFLTLSYFAYRIFL